MELAYDQPSVVKKSEVLVYSMNALFKPMHESKILELTLLKVKFALK